jgi:protein MAK11
MHLVRRVCRAGLCPPCLFDVGPVSLRLVCAGTDAEPTLRSSFLLPAHLGCVRTVAACGKWIASGSSDEVVSIMDVEKMAQVMSLHHHAGDVTSLAFHADKFLFSASSDGNICVYRCPDWPLLATLKGHKDAVTAIAVHPSGKVLLSVGKDCTFRIWDLVSAKCALTTKMAKGTTVYAPVMLCIGT